MAIARLSSGEILGTCVDINDAIAPTAVGKFNLPDPVAQKIGSLPMPLSEDGAAYIISCFDKSLQEFAEARGFSHRQVRSFGPANADRQATFSFKPRGPDGFMSAEMLKAYQTPHQVQADELHFLYSGTIAKGLRLGSSLQGVVYITAGEWLHLHAETVNWPTFPSGQSCNAVSFYSKEPQLDGLQFAMTMHPDYKIFDTMKY